MIRSKISTPCVHVGVDYFQDQKYFLWVFQHRLHIPPVLTRTETIRSGSTLVILGTFGPPSLSAAWKRSITVPVKAARPPWPLIRSSPTLPKRRSAVLWQQETSSKTGRVSTSAGDPQNSVWDEHEVTWAKAHGDTCGNQSWHVR